MKRRGVCGWTQANHKFPGTSEFYCLDWLLHLTDKQSWAAGRDALCLPSVKPGAKVNNLSQGWSLTPGCFVAALNKNFAVIQCRFPYTPCLHPTCPEWEKQAQEGSADLLSLIVSGWASPQPGRFLREHLCSLVASASGSSCNCWVTSVQGILVNPQHQAGISSFFLPTFSPHFHPVLGQHQQVLCTDLLADPWGHGPGRCYQKLFLILWNPV